MPYPDEFDDLAVADGTGPSLDEMGGATDLSAHIEQDHTDFHGDEAGAIRRMQRNAGLNPEGGYSDVSHRLDAIEDGGSFGLGRKTYGWYRALTNRATTKAKFMVLADSRGEGCGVTLATRWSNLLLDETRTRFPTIGGDKGRGYLPTDYACTNLDAERPARSGNVVDSFAAVGPGLHSTELRASTGSGNGKLTWSLVGTHADLYYAVLPSAGKSEYRIDGGAWVEVNHNGGAGFVYQIAQTRIVLGASGAHTVEWQWKSQGAGIGPTPLVCGIFEFDGDPATGIEFLDATHGGITTTQIAAAASQVTEWVADYDPAVVFVDLGTNDWGVSDPDNIDEEVSDYRTELGVVAAAIFAGNANTEVVLLGGWTPRASLSTGEAADWPLFRNQQYDLASTDERISVWDMRRAVPEPDSPGDVGLGVTSETFDFLAIHLEERGHRAVADGLAGLMTPTPGVWGPARPAGTIHRRMDTVANVGGGEDDLFSFLLPPRLFSRTGDRLDVVFAGFVSGSANSKQLRFRLGGAILFDTTMAAMTNGGAYGIRLTIVRIDADSIRYVLSGSFPAIPAIGFLPIAASGQGQIDSLNFGAEISFRATGESGGAASDDVFGTMLLLDFVPAGV